jgi:protein-L-isoaspartate(D-aspartate) O-methyltransferase
MASWRSGYAEDCKSLHPGSIPGEASNSFLRRAAGYRAALQPGRGAFRMALTALERDAAAQRLKMVNGQLRVCDVNDLALLAAFLDTPREIFVEPEMAPFAYLDSDQPSLGSPTRRLLPPTVLARLLQAAEVKPGERVLDVGGGAGYGAAILEHLGAQVVALENDAGAAAAARKLLNGRAGIETVEGDLAAGAKGRGPFAVIVVEGAFEVSPDSLLAELAEKGRLVGIDAREGAPVGILIERLANGFGRRALFDAGAACLESFKRAPRFAF